jgi:prepilin-type N-terminal cleavage/methylation domain-containing protein
MTLKLKKLRGFTLIEITLVIIVMGLLASALVPMVTGVIGRTQADAERAKLKVLKEALLADALEKGGFVDPLTDATNVAATYTGARIGQYLPASANALALGLPLTSGFNNQAGDNLSAPVPAYLDLRPASFLYDVRTTLTRAGAASSPLSFCNNAVTALNTTVPPAVAPQVCQRAAGSDTLYPCTTPADVLVPAAMVLVSRGKNRQFEFENRELRSADGTAAAVGPTLDTANVYESPNRGVNYSNDVGAYYDDAVESISISEVVSACQKRGILSVPSCPVGQRQLRLFNNSSVPISYNLDAKGCVPAGIPKGSEYPLGCVSSSTLVVNVGADCATGTQITNNLTLASDVNGDLTTLVTCTDTTCTAN